MQVFADDGARIDASVDGRERAHAIVLIHGFPFARAIWDMQTDALAKRWLVVRPDLRGAGKSSAPEGPYLMERLASDVAVLLDALGIERAALIGHSMGGYVALAFARMFTERITHLALVSSRLRADTPDEAATRCALAERIERQGDIEPVICAYLPRLFAPRTLAQHADVVDRAYAIARQNGAAGASGTLRGMALRAPSDDIAQDLAAPMLIVAGACDNVITLQEAHSIARSFARGNLAVCDASGHLPMMEEPQRVSEALEAWLNE
ncbi:MAG: alpha/beta fold hydrolase [Candidatus Eremiobacteraeota bacterium]|nr:alpha/beta fold hydrolase [Candidatus Eremiobacteraeota bacterium]